MGIDRTVNAIIGYPRHTNSFTYSGTGWTTAYPATNAQNTTYARVARSNAVGGSPSLTPRLRGTSASPRTLQLFGIAAHNMKPDTNPQYQLKLYSDNAWTTQIYDSGLQNVWPSAFTYEGRDWYTDGFWFAVYSNEEITGQIPFVPIYLSQSYTAQSWQIDFIDPSNADGYIQLGLFEVASAFQLPVNPSYGANYGLRQFTKVSELDGGLKRFDIYDPAYVFEGSVEYMPEDDVMNVFFELSRQYGISTPFIWLPYPKRLTTWLKTSKMVTQVDTGLFAHADFGYDAVPLRLQEWKG